MIKTKQILDLLAFSKIEGWTRKPMIKLADDLDSVDASLPERVLLCAVLERAIKDLEVKPTTNIYIITEALAWFGGKQCKGPCISFEMILHELPISPARLQYINECIIKARIYVNQPETERQTCRAVNSGMVTRRRGIISKAHQPVLRN